MKLYKFFWDCGRMGSLDGLFAAEPDALEEAIGHELYFGEVLGKHSEIYGPLSKEDIELLPIDDVTVQVLIEAFGDTTFSGFNPVAQYFEQKECGDYDEKDGLGEDD